MQPFDRRKFLKAFLAAGLLDVSNVRAQINSTLRFSVDPFRLGIASGYPSPGGVVLWTRLVTAPDHADGGIPPYSVPVRWEIASDDRMHKIVASGIVVADPAWGHSVHIEVRGLEPDRPYWYRFTAGGVQSPVGRTRTAPAIDTAVTRMKFAFASCQHYEKGYFSAYRYLIADELDFIAFLGDYIYETSFEKNTVRTHNTPEPYTLADYRARYAQYKSDADLQEAHRACPWVVIWDDHEVDNDYADDLPEDGMPREQFLVRRAAAYRAYYEHMPLPERMRPRGPAAKIYSRFDWGTLATFHLLDDRQYRSHEACSKFAHGGGSNTVDTADCPALADPSRTMLGSEQEAWLNAGFMAARGNWNVIAQQTLMAQIDRKPGPGSRAWTDGWDGYPVARRRLLEGIAARRPANPVVIGGDVHSYWAAELKTDFDDPNSPVVASEFCGSSITSDGPAQTAIDALLPENPHVKYARGNWRGYVRVEMRPAQLRADFRAMETVKVADAACNTIASFAVESGRLGPQKI